MKYLFDCLDVRVFKNRHRKEVHEAARSSDGTWP